jgi:hypothetical protein
VLPSPLLITPTFTFKSFEVTTITLKLPRSKLTICNIYRPPPTSAVSRNKSTFSQFLEDFQCLVSTVATLPHEFIITGDFNIHVDNPTDSYTQQFLSVLNDANLTQHVTFPTHSHSHTLDLVITGINSSLRPSITRINTSPSDHFPVLSTVNITPPSPPPLSKVTYRSIKSVNIEKFKQDILSSSLIMHPPTKLSDLVDCYNYTLSSILDKHAPVKTEFIRLKPANPWFTPALNKLKHACRSLQRVWLRSHSLEDLKLLRTATNHYHAAISNAKRDYFSSLITTNATNPRKLWNTVNSLLHRKPPPVLPSYTDPSSLCQSFAKFFCDKVTDLHAKLLAKTTHTSPHTSPSHHPTNLSYFQPTTADEVCKLLTQSPVTNCELDPIPTTLLLQCSSILVPTITNIINLSLATGVFPQQFKTCSVHPLLKKSNLDRENLSNYRPVSHLSFLSKLTERIVQIRLMHHLSSHNLLNPFQSAYIKFHSTETALLALHDHIIRAMGQQQITCLCLLDLSAAFDTIDHSILLERLSSWFGLDRTVLSWIASYLTNRSFHVSLNNFKSSSFPLQVGVPQGSVLGPLLFILYTTPLSHIISSCNTHHHLYADDTQLYVSFSTTSFSDKISHLETTISSVQNWMTSNFLSLNPSKTEFLLLGLPRQLDKLQNPKISLPGNVVLSPVTSARNLGVIFDSNMSLSEHISAISKSCFQHIRDLQRIRNTINLSTACTIASSLIHSKLDYCNSLLLNLPVSSLKRLQFVLNSAARAVTNTSKFSHITPILKSLHWLKIEQRIHFKILSLTYKALDTNRPTYLRSLLTVQDIRNTRSASIVSLVHPTNPSRLKITNRSFFHMAPVLWNRLPTNLRARSQCPAENSSASPSPFALSPSQFHAKLKSYLFHHSFPP